MANYSNERKYALKIYHRTADKPDCPQCGKRNRFSEYIDLKTGKPVGPGCGKCDRENHCQYRVTPWEYFRLHPEARNSGSIQASHTMTPKPKLASTCQRTL